MPGLDASRVPQVVERMRERVREREREEREPFLAQGSSPQRYGCDDDLVTARTCSWTFRHGEATRTPKRGSSSATNTQRTMRYTFNAFPTDTVWGSKLTAWYV